MGKSRGASKSRSAKASKGRARKQSLSEAAKALADSTSATSILHYADDLQDESRKFAEREFGVELALCRALIAAGGWFAMALAANRGDARLYPRDWIGDEAAGNPDVIMGCVLCQVANYGYSVVNLVEQGLDTPARALLRSAADLCFTLALLANDREALQTYVHDKSLSEKERWYRLFSSRKLTARLREIDRAIGLPAEWTKSMEDYRLQNNEFFSEATHHSPNAILIGSYPCNPRTGRHGLGLFGGPNRFSGATLRHLLGVLNYGLVMFLGSTRTFNPRFEQPRFFGYGVELVVKVQPMYSEWLRACEVSESADSQSEVK